MKKERNQERRIEFKKKRRELAGIGDCMANFTVEKT